MSMTLMAIVGLSCNLETSDLNKALDTLDLPLSITHTADLREHTGFLPAEISGQEAGVETYFETSRDLIDCLPPHEALDNREVGVVLFSIGSRASEIASALYIASALVSRCQALVFDAESGRYMSNADALKYAEFVLKTEDG